jgi:hypothetical protein
MTDVKVHDLRQRYWGHSIEFLRRNEDGSWQAMIFLSARISDGDEVLAESRTPGRTLHYRVVGDVRRAMNPGDQHFLTLQYQGDE